MKNEFNDDEMTLLGFVAEKGQVKNTEIKQEFGWSKRKIRAVREMVNKGYFSMCIGYGNSGYYLINKDNKSQALLQLKSRIKSLREEVKAIKRKVR